MLTHLSIRNVVLIEAVDIDFHKGLTVLTGETGAGKSILLDSLSLALGARSDSDFVAQGAEQCSVSATFELSKTHPVWVLCEENGLLMPDQSPLILRRVIAKDGKSKAFINDQAIGVTLLKKVGDLLVEIHGQFANHALLNPATHQDVVDHYGQLHGLKEETSLAYMSWQEKKKAYQKAVADLQKAKEEEEYLRHNVHELETLSPKEGEEKELAERRTFLQNSEKLLEGIKGAFQALTQNGEVDAHLRRAQFALEKNNEKAGNTFSSVIELLENAANQSQEAFQFLEKISSQMDAKPEELEEVEGAFICFAGCGAQASG